MKRYKPALSRDDEDCYADMQECQYGEYVKVEDVKELGDIILQMLKSLRVEGAPEKAEELSKKIKSLGVFICEVFGKYT